MRKRQARIKEIVPDLKYNDKLMARFINSVTLDGKKSIAAAKVYAAVEAAAKEAQEGGPAELLGVVVKKVVPRVEVKSRRIGGANYQVPVAVTERRGISVAIRWIIQAARKRGEYGFENRLKGEFLDILKDRGGALKKLMDVKSMADSNRAFAYIDDSKSNESRG